MAAVCIVMIVLTGVRMTFGGVVICLCVFLVSTRRFLVLAGFLALFALAGLVTGVFQARFDDFFNPSRTSEWNTLEDRQEIWAVLDRGIRERPWAGHGLGSTRQTIAESPQRTSSVALSAHNDYRKYLFEAGIPAGVCYAAMWLALLWRTWRSRSLGGSVPFACAAVSALVCSIMAMATLNESASDYATMALFWSLAGAALGSTVRARKSGTMHAESEVKN
jgi:O-antigen ligase